MKNRKIIITEGNETVELLGFFKKESDGTEYIYYQINDRKFLTNGVCSWHKNAEEFVNKKNMKAISQIDKEKMLEKLVIHMPYSDAIGLIS